ncbi:hypothetical protein Gotur_004577 [Gossypium turneri]
MFPKDGVYTTQPIYSKCRVNLVETNQFNSHIGSSLPEDAVYRTQPAYSERRINLEKPIISMVILEVASQKMEFIQLNQFIWSVGLTHFKKKHSTVMLEVASKMSF